MNKFKIQIFKDSFKYSRKRKTATKNILVATFAILASTIVASLIAAMFGYNPFETIRILFSAAFINEPDKFSYMLCVFALAAFAFSFAFKAGIFNIGISGQMYGAGVVLLVVTTALKDVPFPPFVGQIFSLLIAMTVGSLIALCTGAMERYLKVNSVVSAIILNWIILLIGFFVIGAWYSNNADYSQMTASTDIPSQFTLAGGSIAGWIPSIIIVVIIAMVLLILSKYTVFGHKIKSTGLSLEGSRYAGYNVNMIKLATFAISGALSGVLAVILYTSRTPNIPATILNVVVPIEGFNGIAVGLIAGNNPIGIIAVSAIIGLFKTSSSFLPMSPVFNDVIIGLLMLGAALTTVFYQYKPWIFLLKKKYTVEADDIYTIYENKLDSTISKYKSIYSVYKKLNSQNRSFSNEIINNAIASEQSSYNSIDQILNDYNNEIAKVKNAYNEAVIHEWMILKLKPQKYIKLNNEKIITYYDEKLTHYVSKQKSRIESNSEFVSKNTSIKSDAKIIYKNLKNEITFNQAKIIALIKSAPNINKNDLATLMGVNIEFDLQKLINNNFIFATKINNEYVYSYNYNSLMAHDIEEDNNLFNKMLLDINENKWKKIAISINQNSAWKEEAINKNEQKLSKEFTISSNNLLNYKTIPLYESNDKNLNKINQQAIRMIEKDILDANTKNQLLTILADYNNEIIKSGGKLC